MSNARSRPIRYSWSAPLRRKRLATRKAIDGTRLSTSSIKAVLIACEPPMAAYISAETNDIHNSVHQHRRSAWRNASCCARGSGRVWAGCACISVRARVRSGGDQTPIASPIAPGEGRCAVPAIPRPAREPVWGATTQPGTARASAGHGRRSPRADAPAPAHASSHRGAAPSTRRDSPWRLRSARSLQLLHQ